MGDNNLIPLLTNGADGGTTLYVVSLAFLLSSIVFVPYHTIGKGGLKSSFVAESASFVRSLREEAEAVTTSGLRGVDRTDRDGGSADEQPQVERDEGLLVCGTLG